MDIDLKLMIFGIQISLIGGFIVVTNTSYSQQSVMNIGVLLIFIGTILSLVGLLVRVKPKKPA
jgi:energy-converting hydrogenase Eha subunit C